MVVLEHRFECVHCDATHDVGHTPGRAAPYPRGWSKWDITLAQQERNERVLCPACTERLLVAVGEAGF